MSISTSGFTAAGSRANAYLALARALEPPLEWDPRLPDLLHEGLAGLNGRDGLIASLSEAADSASNDIEATAVHHAKLFVGPFEIVVPPWASFFLEKDPRLMGPTSTYAATAYAEAGLAPGEALKDAPDHITHELEFMYFLAYSYDETGETEWFDRQSRFWGEHLGLWLPDFARKLLRANRDHYYNALAEVIVAFAEDEQELFDSRTIPESPA